MKLSSRERFLIGVLFTPHYLGYGAGSIYLARTRRIPEVYWS